MVLRLGRAVGPLLLGVALVLGGLDALFHAAAGVAVVVGGMALLLL